MNQPGCACIVTFWHNILTKWTGENYSFNNFAMMYYQFPLYIIIICEYNASIINLALLAVCMYIGNILTQKIIRFKLYNRAFL